MAQCSRTTWRLDLTVAIRIGLVDSILQRLRASKRGAFSQRTAASPGVSASKQPLFYKRALVLNAKGAFEPVLAISKHSAQNPEVICVTGGGVGLTGPGAAIQIHA